MRPAHTDGDQDGEPSSYCVEVGSYGSKRESDPLSYISNLSEVGITDAPMPAAIISSIPWHYFDRVPGDFYFPYKNKRLKWSCIYGKNFRITTIELSGVGMRDTLKTLLDYVLIGVIGFLPVVLVVQIVIYVERFLKDFVLLVHGKYENPLVTVALFLTAVAMLAYFGRLLKHDRAHLLYYLEKFILRIPIIGSIYRVTRKLLRLFLTTEESQVREVVYVEYPKEGMWVPAYVTNRVGDCYILYVPTSPNPTSGFTVMVHKSKVKKSNMNIEEVSSFVISVGVDYDKPEEAAALYK
ncbi:MAG: DUF502 domain-containing protein [Gammaproteobacteria bacterium]